MTKIPLKNIISASLRSGAIQGTAVTVDDASVLATDLKDARIDAMMSGFFELNVEDADDGDGDETYVIELTGRQDDADAYEVLASITVTRAVLGQYRVSVPEFRKQLNYSIDFGVSTTPSITFAATVHATECQLLPDFGTVIVA